MKKGGNRKKSPEMSVAALSSQNSSQQTLKFHQDSMGRIQ